MLKVSKIRSELGVTQKQLAEASGLNIRWVQKLESGEINIDNVTLKNAVLLLKGLNDLCPSDTVIEDFQALKSAFIIVRQLLQ